MDIKDSRIDGGKAFDWGRTSADYAKYRDIYPPEFYEKITGRGLCLKGQKVLDLATGTGVLPRNLYTMGAEWTGIDIAENQILSARELAEAAGMDITFITSAAEELELPDGSFDVVTACQCFWYFNYETLMPKVARLLKKGGRFVILCMNWLPFEDKTAEASENLVLKYNPGWTGGGETRHPIAIPEAANDYFELTDSEVFDLHVPFTRTSWNGRMKACRGVGASLSPEQIAAWEKEHNEMLEKNCPEEFTVLHYGAIAVLTKK